MRRHESLIPLSREHHHLLVLAQILKQDVPPYKNMPQTPVNQRDYALERYENFIKPHFRWEEDNLLPLAQRYGNKLTRIAEQVKTQHQELHEAFENLATVPTNKLEQQLDVLGHQLAKHIRFEERIFFEKLQELVPQIEWIGLVHPGRSN